MSHVATLVTGTALSQGINVAALLILTRLFAPEAFGLLALFMTIVSLLSVLGGARYELAIMLPESDREAANLFYLSVLVLGAICVGCLGVVGAQHHRIALALGDSSMDPWLWTVPAVLFVSGLNQVLGYWCGRMKRFRHVAIARVAQTAGTVVTQVILFALHTGGGIALIGGWIFGQSLGTVVLFAKVMRQDGRFLRNSRDWGLIRSLLWTYRKFPFYKAPYSFIANVSSQLVIVIIRFFSNLTILGLFSMASRAIYMPVSLITSSMNEVFYQKAATEIKTGRLEAFVNRVLRIQILLMTPLLVFAAFESKLLFRILFGPRWSGSGEFAALLAFAGYMYFLTSWLDRLFDVSNHQRLSLALEIGGNLLSLGALTLVMMLSKNALWGVAAFTVGEVIYCIVWLYCAYYAANFRLGTLRQLARNAFVTGAPVLAGMGAIHVLLRDGWALAVSAIFVFTLEVVFFFRFVRGNQAFSSTEERFRSYWEDKTSPLHKCDTPEFYRTCALELKSLFPNKKAPETLEIGCGDGGLFPFLDLPRAKYTGVDFSSQLLARFHSSHPDVELKCTEGSSYLEEGHLYDLIFSHGVIQHFDPEMLHRHFENARFMMHPDSLLICASVLNKQCRNDYEAGSQTSGVAARQFRMAKSRVRRLLGLDPMGYWYNQRDLARIAQAHGFETSFVRSVVYPYRFHVVLRIKMKSSTESAERPMLRAPEVFSAARGAMTQAADPKSESCF